MSICQTCHTSLPDHANFCPECGEPVTPHGTNSAQVTGRNGVAVAGNNARVKVTHKSDGWDKRPSTRFDGKEKPVAGWLELAASILSLGAATISAFAATNTDDFSSVPWIITFAVAGVVAVVVGFFAFHFVAARLSGHSTVRVGGWFLGLLVKESHPARLVWIFPRAVCMYCPNHTPGVMKPRVRGDEIHWVCTTNPRQHTATFDWTQVQAPPAT